ncbi:hypothetical protein POPTR_003G200750v4 [Populus trichocarpa]|uniref:Uncharacterized protein n=1 Tax=Populus trichocarpa TaxID=3694 RepID=A0ACC0TAZ0_POPTR|nr:hypothetical protein POPTR_003G200750v4 [Populus trichocarpa]
MVHMHQRLDVFCQKINFQALGRIREPRSVLSIKFYGSLLVHMIQSLEMISNLVEHLVWKRSLHVVLGLINIPGQHIC